MRIFEKILKILIQCILWIIIFCRYLFYASSIDAVYKHHLHLQLQIENLRAAAKFKSEEKERIQQGKCRFLNKNIFLINLMPAVFNKIIIFYLMLTC